MGLPKVAITLGNGNLGRTVATDDGVAGLVLTGVATNQLPLAVPTVLFSLSDAAAIGITDGGTNTYAYRHIKEFYDIAGEGAELYIMLVENTVTMPQIVDLTNANGAVKLLDAAKGRIRLLGITFTPADLYLAPQGEGMDGNVLDAVPKAQQLAQAYADQFKPVRILLEANAIDIDHPEKLKDLRTFSAKELFWPALTMTALLSVS